MEELRANSGSLGYYRFHRKLLFGRPGLFERSTL
jgi:hypothetical protein